MTPRRNTIGDMSAEARSDLRLASFADLDAGTLYAILKLRSEVFVVEQAGRIRVIKGGRVLANPFLDLTAKTHAGGERR